MLNNREVLIPNRTLCDTLEAMRKCHETRNYSYLLGLIEEAQNLANRMEAALWDQKDFKRAEKRYKKLKKEIEELYTFKKEMENDE